MTYRATINPWKRKAAVSVLIAVLVPVFVGIAALSVDLGMVAIARADLQRTADAAVMASMDAFANATEVQDPYALAMAMAADYVERNPVIGEGVLFNPASNVVFGHAYFDEAANTYDFVADDLPTNAIRIVVTKNVNYYFAGLFGKDSKHVDAEAIAMFVQKQTIEADCYDTVPPGMTMICRHGDSDDSDDSAAGDSDDSDDSDPGDSDGSTNGDPDDSDDSEFGDSDDSDDSQALGHGLGHGDSDSGSPYDSDSETGYSLLDSDAPHTAIVDTNAVASFLAKGDTLGPCDCLPGDIDDSDDSEFGDSADSDDSDPMIGDGGAAAAALKANTTIICHIPSGNPSAAHTLRVKNKAVAVHIGHGDHIGPCSGDRKVKIYLIK